jgi:hypothetical protein
MVISTNADEKKHREFILDNIVKVVLQDKLKATNYRLPRGYYDKFLNSYSTSCPWLTSKMIRGVLIADFQKSLIQMSCRTHHHPLQILILTALARKLVAPKGPVPKKKNT